MERQLTHSKRKAVEDCEQDAGAHLLYGQKKKKGQVVSSFHTADSNAKETKRFASIAWCVAISKRDSYRPCTPANSEQGAANKSKADLSDVTA